MSDQVAARAGVADEESNVTVAKIYDASDLVALPANAAVLKRLDMYLPRRTVRSSSASTCS